MAVLILAMSSQASAQISTDVHVELEQFGVGSAYREGELTAIRVRLTSDPAASGDQATPAWVQWEVPNADGDIVEYGRAVTLTRGRPTAVWLYAPLSPDVNPDTIWPIRVFELRDGQRRGEIGGRRIRAGDASLRPELTPINVGLIGVVGQRQMGLQSYGVLFDQLDRPWAAHEQTRVAFGIRPDLISDRWQGLKQFEAIAWSNASPQELTTDTAAALREYVRRGGHLIISLPEDINPWQFGTRGQTLLDDILPQREPRKDEAVHVSELLPIMSKARGTAANFTVSIRVFKDLDGDFDAINNHYEPLIALPDGRVVAVQRTVGFGRVTVIGLDLSSQRLAAVPLSNGSIGLPQADVFWNRVLGRRADTPTSQELEQIRQADLLMRPSASGQNLASGGLISQQIAMSTQAGFGLLMAIVLFGLYWLVAGPGGFGMLKMYKQVKHAWLAFALAAGLFTAIAWGTVGVIRIKEPQVRHLTVLDHVARPGTQTRSEDPQQQRVMSWFELYIPGYGRPRISIDRASSSDILLPWTPPGETMQRFPNVDRYSIDVAAAPANYSVPSRSTSTQLYAHWMGGLDQNWGGLIRSHPDDPIRVVTDGAGNELRLTGAITHELPGTLRDVIIIWNRNNRLTQRLYVQSGDQERPYVSRVISGQMLNSGYIFRTGRWDPNTVLDLRNQDYTASALLSRGIHERYVSEHQTASGPRPMTGDMRRKFLEMHSFFHQLTPPEYVKLRPDESEPTNRVIFNRHVARELDLSEWFTRPCIIVIGYLDDSELPIPLRINDGDAVPVSSGVTMVRWIYPLPLSEDIAFPRGVDDDDEL